MSGRKNIINISRRQLLTLVIAGGVIIALLGLIVGLVLTSLFAEPPAALVVAIIAVFTLQVLFSLLTGISRLMRRSARRRRMRHKGRRAANG